MRKHLLTLFLLKHCKRKSLGLKLVHHRVEGGGGIENQILLMMFETNREGFLFCCFQGRFQKILVNTFIDFEHGIDEM